METLRYALFDYWDEVGDPRVSHFPLMSGGPLGLLVIIAAYLSVVLYFGPRFMATRTPYSLRSTILVYNLFQLISSIVFLVASVVILDNGRRLFNFTREKFDTSERVKVEINIGYVYFLSKLLDLVETIFFVARHKSSQVSFLHVYHHSVVPLIVWVGLKIAPTSGPPVMFPLLNSAVHVVMYAYYFTAALGPKYQRYLWWKQYITTFQLVQFVIFILYGVVFTTLQRDFPLILVLIPNIQSPLFFVLFYNFFQKTYRQKKVSLPKQEQFKVK